MLEVDNIIPMWRFVIPNTANYQNTHFSLGKRTNALTVDTYVGSTYPKVPAGHVDK